MRRSRRHRSARGRSVVAVAGGAPPVFDPATLALTGWWRADFAGSPWVGTASDGTSGDNDLSEATTPPDTLGDAINSLEPANFNGTNDVLASTAHLADFVGDSSSGWVLFNADSAVADAGAGSRLSNPQFFGDQNQLLGCGFSSAGIHLAVFTTVGSTREVAIACGTGGWHLAQWRVTHQTRIELGLDSGAMQPNNDFSGEQLHGSRATICRVGVRGTGITSFFDGRIAEIGVTNGALSDEDFTSIRSYINTRYGLSL